MDSSRGGESTPVPVELDLKNPVEEWARVASLSLNVICLNVGGLLRLWSVFCGRVPKFGVRNFCLGSWFRNLIILKSFKFSSFKSS